MTPSPSQDITLLRTSLPFADGPAYAQDLQRIASLGHIHRQPHPDRATLNRQAQERKAAETAQQQEIQRLVAAVAARQRQALNPGA